MKLVLNIGMHKTGTSAIQQTLSKYDQDGVRYLEIGHPNHSGLYSTLFMREPWKYHAHKKNERSEAQVQEIRSKFQIRLKEVLEKFSKDKITTVLSSAEDIVLMDMETLANLRNWCEQNFEYITLVGYARPPISFLTSAIQQRVAGGVNWNFSTLYPNYRELFEKFDLVFGQARVKLRRFHSDSLYKSDVVCDFLSYADVEFDASSVKKENQSRSLQATATLHAQRTLGRGWKNYPGSPIHNRALVGRLQKLGSDKIVIDEAVAQKFTESHKHDLDWISERVGENLYEKPNNTLANKNNAISSKDDLLKVAGRQLPGLLDIIKEEIENDSVDPKIVADVVDILLEIIKQKSRRVGRKSARTQSDGS